MKQLTSIILLAAIGCAWGAIAPNAAVARASIRHVNASERSGVGVDATLKRIEVAAGKKTRVVVVSSDQADAYVMPGGAIVLTSALIEACRTNDEMAFVLGHEAAHVAAGDVAVYAGRRPGFTEKSGELKPEFLQKEIDADRYAMRLAEKAGFDPSAGRGLLVRLGTGREGSEARTTESSSISLRLSAIDAYLAGRR